jgi:hypothetical protein
MSLQLLDISISLPAYSASFDTTRMFSLLLLTLKLAP